MSTCQLCGKPKECRIVRVDTTSCHQHKKNRIGQFKKLSKTQGSALLSVCQECCP